MSADEICRSLPKWSHRMTLTDDRAAGLTTAPVEALRYDNDQDLAFESSGQIVSMIPQGARVLDVGCGTGWLARLIHARRDAEVVGLEPHPIRAQAARDQGLTVHTGELSAETLDELGKFDVILFADVLEHLVSPADVLRLAATGLCRGGSIIASIPNVAHWTVRWNLLAGKFDYAPVGIMDATHVRWFTRKTVRQLFDTAGLRVAEHVASAGTWMIEYRRRPFSWIRPRTRQRLICRLSQKWPGLFGCQHVVRGVLR